MFDMEYNNENHSCLECIWHDQCESEEICSMFDPGRLPTDEEIEFETEIKREQYKLEYQKYIEESGGELFEI